MITREEIESFGWVFKREFDRFKTYNGQSPTKQEFQFGDTWQDDGRGGFLTFYPETGEVIITTTDKGFNADGPNHSKKFNGHIVDKMLFGLIMHAINLKQ